MFPRSVLGDHLTTLDSLCPQEIKYAKSFNIVSLQPNH